MLLTSGLPKSADLRWFCLSTYNREKTYLTFPVESVEPLVLLDVADPSLLVAKSLSTVVSEIRNFFAACVYVS